MILALTNGILLDTSEPIKTPKGSKAILTGCRVYIRDKGYKYEAKIKTGLVWVFENEINPN